MDTKIEELIELLGKAGLISHSKMTELRSSTFYAPDGESTLTAKELVQLGCLTEFQASEISEGHIQKLIVGEYVLLDRIGRGGMGHVYKARHCVMQRDVAIKFMLPSRDDDESSTRRFRREVQTASKLSHPNIVAALDAGQRDGVSYLVMEYVDGINLAKLVQSRGPMSIERAVDSILQSATGLEYAHQHGVIHRDVKPSNLLLTQEGHLKILDMGLARIQPPISSTMHDDESEDLTEQGEFLGTIDFMAPEQALDPRNADKRADIYSLGCTLYYLLVGEPPFGGDSMTTRIVAHRESPIPSLFDARPDIPNSLEQCFFRMMAKDVKDRYQDMGDVIRDLKRCVQHLSAAGEDNHDTVTWHGNPLDDSRNTSWFPWAALAGTLLLGMGLVVFLLNRDNPPTDNPPGPPESHGSLIPGDGGGGSQPPEPPLISVKSYPTDLLASIDPGRDAVAGTDWEKTESGLLTGTVRAARLQIPVAVPPQYVWTIRLVRREGGGPLLLGLPVEDSQCYVMLDRNGTSGLGATSAHQLVQQTAAVELPLDTPVDIECRVGPSRIEVAINGEPAISYEGDLSELEVPDAYQIPRTDILFIATNRLRSGEPTRFEIQKMTLDRWEARE